MRSGWFGFASSRVKNLASTISPGATDLPNLGQTLQHANGYRWNMSEKFVQLRNPSRSLPVALRRTGIFIGAKNLFRWADRFFWRAILRFQVPDSTKTLFVVHVGKSGGTFIREIIGMSEKISQEFSNIQVVHTVSVPLHKRSRYLIVLRDPIRRSLSAFNWRYSMVVVGGEPGRFPREARVLARYKSLSKLGEDLYSEGALNRSVVQDFRAIHHLRENIQYHLRFIYGRISKKQLYAVITQENLVRDAWAFLGVDVQAMPRLNSSSPALPEQTVLSSKATANLAKYLSGEYRALAWLQGLSDGAPP